MKTIRQIADEIGVSKQAVFKKIKREPLSTSLQGLTATVDGRLMVEVDGEKLIKQAFSEISPSTTDNQLTGTVDGLVDGASTKNAEKTTGVDGVISVLQATIDTLQGQLEMKDRQIEQQAQTITRLTDALAPAQLSPVSLFIMGAAFCMVELTSAFPYFGFLALLTSYHLIFPLALLFMLIYNFMYMLPLILLYFGYNKLQGTTTIKKLESVLDKVSSYIVPVVVSLVGILLVY